MAVPKELFCEILSETGNYSMNIEADILNFLCSVRFIDIVSASTPKDSDLSCRNYSSVYTNVKSKFFADQPLWCKVYLTPSFYGNGKERA